MLQLKRLSSQIFLQGQLTGSIAHAQMRVSTLVNLSPVSIHLALASVYRYCQWLVNVKSTWRNHRDFPIHLRNRSR